MGRSAARTRRRISAVVIGGLIAACKAAPTAAPPGEAGLRDDIAAIEAELERNADDLEAEGIYVARADHVQPQPVQQQPPRDEFEGDVSPTAEPELGEEDEAAVDSERSEGVASGRKSKESREGYWSRWLSKRERKKDEAQRCQRICDLAEATCELADRICELAQRHPDEVRYETACERAEHQCRVAAEACTACAE
jgi:hypothetical protein